MVYETAPYLTSGDVAVNMSETAAVAFSFIRHEIDSAAARKAVAARRRTEKTAAPSTVEKPATSVADTTTAEPSPQHSAPAAPGLKAPTRLPRKLKKSLKKQIAAAAARRDHHRLNRYPIDASAVRMADMKV